MQDSRTFFCDSNNWASLQHRQARRMGAVGLRCRTVYSGNPAQIITWNQRARAGLGLGGAGRYWATPSDSVVDVVRSWCGCLWPGVCMMVVSPGLVLRLCLGRGGAVCTGGFRVSRLNGLANLRDVGVAEEADVAVLDVFERRRTHTRVRSVVHGLMRGQTALVWVTSCCATLSHDLQRHEVMPLGGWSSEA